MWPNLLETADLVTCTEEILNERFQFLFSQICAYFKFLEITMCNLIVVPSITMGFS